MTRPRKHPSPAFCITVALVVLLVAYPVSFGPACWLADRLQIATPFVARIYKPIVHAALCGPGPIREVLRRFAEFGAPPRNKESVLGIWERWTRPVSILETLDSAA